MNQSRKKMITVVLCTIAISWHGISFAQVQDYLSDSRLDKDVKTFLKTINGDGPPLESLPPLKAREVLVGLQAATPVDLSGIDVSEKQITADGYTIKLNIVRPTGVKKVLPVFIFIHGGGWVLGDFPTHK